MRYAAFGLWLLLAACTRSPSTVMPEPIRLRVLAPPGLTELAIDLTEAYAEKAPYVSLTVGVQPAEATRDAVATRKADVALVPGPVDVGPDSELQAEVIGYEAIVVAVHLSNPVQALTWDELQAIFSGQVWSWHDVDRRWEPREILVIVQHEGAVPRRVFERWVMRGARVTPRAVVAPGDAAARDLIAAEPTAIGYLAAGLAGDRVKVLTVGNVAPDPGSVTSQEWPLSRPIVLLRHVDASVYVLEFVEFVLSPTGQRIVGRHYGQGKINQR